MIGISVNGTGSINIGTLPNRVNPALYVVRDGNMVALAYFRSEDDALEAAEMLRKIATAPAHLTRPDEAIEP